MTRRNCMCRSSRRVLYWLLLFMNAHSPRKKGRRSESKRESIWEGWVLRSNGSWIYQMVD